MNLYEASKQGNIRRIQELLREGADVNEVNRGNSTPLHVAKNANVARLLLDGGADINAINNNGTTPLCSAKNIGLITFLLENGADPNIRDNRGNTALHKAMSGEHASLLINYGANPNAMNDAGSTPLHYIFARARLETSITAKVARDYIQTVIDGGANVNVLNRDRMTPLYIAVMFGMQDCITILLNAGASTAIRDSMGMTLLQMLRTYTNQCPTYRDTSHLLASRLIQQKWRDTFAHRRNQPTQMVL